MDCHTPFNSETVRGRIRGEIVLPIHPEREKDSKEKENLKREREPNRISVSAIVRPVAKELAIRTSGTVRFT